MKKINTQLNFFLNLARVQSVVTRIFDRRLEGGLGFNYFTILYYLSQAPDEKMRRIDLAEKIALTASGVTRILIPMEKIGLVKREKNERDARVGYVKLSPRGKRLLNEALETAEYLSEEILPSTKLDKIKDISEIFSLFSFKQPDLGQKYTVEKRLDSKIWILDT